MGETAEQGCCHLRIAKHTRPFAEAEAGYDDDAGAMRGPAGAGCFTGWRSGAFFAPLHRIAVIDIGVACRQGLRKARANLPLFSIGRIWSCSVFGGLQVTDLAYPINFIGYEEWVDSGYDPTMSSGDVITRDGEVIGTWRVVGCDPDDDCSEGDIEFVAIGEEAARFSEGFALLDVRGSRGLALSRLTRAIRQWYELSNPETS